MSGAMLEGFRVGVTAHRRSRDLIEALERRGAQILHAPALRIAPMEEETSLLEDTRAIIAASPDIVVATTAYGVRRWFDSADAAGLGDALLATLQASRIYVRGPKARGAIRAAGLHDDAISPDETTATLVDALVDEGVAGKSIAVQLHGYVDEDSLGRLRAAGATVLTVAPYRWAAAESAGGANRLPLLIESACAMELDVVVFTSAPAVRALFATAADMGRLEALLEAFSTGVATAAIGPLTAAPLREAGLEPLVPERYRMGALIRLVTEHLAGNHVQSLRTPHGLLEIRGRALRIDGTPVPLPPAPLMLMRALMDARGGVLSRESLAGALDLVPAAHALDMTVSRLRAALPEARLVETVVKRGYRLSVLDGPHSTP